MVADALGKARIIGHEFEVGRSRLASCESSASASTPFDQKDLVVGDRERALHEAPQLGRHGGLKFEPDHRSAPAPLEHALEVANQVLGLFLDFEIGIADHAERALTFHDVSRKQAGMKSESPARA